MLPSNADASRLAAAVPGPEPGNFRWPGRPIRKRRASHFGLPPIGEFRDGRQPQAELIVSGAISGGYSIRVVALCTCRQRYCTGKGLSDGIDGKRASRSADGNLT